MTLKELLNRIRNDIIDKYVQSAFLLKKRIKNNDEELIRQLIELCYDFMYEILSLMFEYIERKYGITAVKPMDKDQIESLFYSKDNISFQERIRKYVENKDNNYLYNIDRFYSSEAMSATNKILFYKLSKFFKYCKIDDLYCCEKCMDKVLSLENWTPTDLVDIADLPPYHSECQCVIIFSDSNSATKVNTDVDIDNEGRKNV